MVAGQSDASEAGTQGESLKFFAKSSLPQRPASRTTLNTPDREPKLMLDVGGLVTWRRGVRNSDPAVTRINLRSNTGLRALQSFRVDANADATGTASKGLGGHPGAERSGRWTANGELQQTRALTPPSLHSHRVVGHCSRDRA